MSETLLISLDLEEMSYSNKEFGVEILLRLFLLIGD